MAGATTVQELRAKITVDDQQAQQAMRRTKDAVQGVEGNVAALFRRTKELRAERAIEGAFEAFTSGSVGNAIVAVTSRLSALGLFGGAAVGLIGVGIAAAISKFHEMHLATIALTAELSKPISFAMGPEALGAALKESEAQMQQFVDKTTGWGASITRALGSIFLGQSGAHTPIERGGFLDERSRAEEETAKNQKRVTDALNEQWKIMKEMIKAAAEAAEVREQSLRGSEREAAIRKAELEYQKTETMLRREQIDYETYLDELQAKRQIDGFQHLQASIRYEQMVNDKLVAAGKIRDLDIEEAKSKSALQERSLDTTRQINEIEASGIPSEVQSVMIQKVRIAALQQELALNKDLTDEKRAQKQSELDSLQANSAKQMIEREQKKTEAQKLTFKELLEPGPVGSSNLEYARYQAREAQRLQQRAEQARQLGRVDEAKALQQRSDEVKGRIDLLKESEKDQFLFHSSVQDFARSVSALVSTGGGKWQGTGDLNDLLGWLNAHI